MKQEMRKSLFRNMEENKKCYEFDIIEMVENEIIKKDADLFYRAWEYHLQSHILIGRHIFYKLFGDEDTKGILNN